MLRAIQFDKDGIFVKVVPETLRDMVELDLRAPAYHIVAEKTVDIDFGGLW